MRLLRALVHLVLALALVTATAAQARAVGAGPGTASPHATHDGGMAVHAAPGHADPASGHPLHKKDACQTACCFVPAQTGGRTDGASAPTFPGAVRYVDHAQPVSGRMCPPEPGVPKRAA